MTDQELYKLLATAIFTSLGESDISPSPEALLAVSRTLAKIACNVPVVIGVTPEKLLGAVLEGIQESRLGVICKMTVVRLAEQGKEALTEDNLEIN